MTPKHDPDITGGTTVAVVIRSTGSWYRVRTEDGRELDCRLRGKFRIEGIKSTNPVAVGDDVRIEEDDTDAVITELLPRRNIIPRKSVNLSKRVHILAANVDQALLLFTLKDPVTTLGYIDRLLVSCEAYDVEPVLIFNKSDLLTEDEDQAKLNDFRRVYEGIGYATRTVSALNPADGEKIRELLRGKTSIVVGRSGAGKSTLINLADPELDLRTGNISDFSGRGKHTTTFAEMFSLSFGGDIIDSPGFKEMEIYNFEKAELSHFFPEMRAELQECRFNNCLHTNEPGCAVKEALSEGRISESRYNTYLSMLVEIEANKGQF